MLLGCIFLEQRLTFCSLHALCSPLWFVALIGQCLFVICSLFHCACVGAIFNGTYLNTCKGWNQKATPKDRVNGRNNPRFFSTLSGVGILFLIKSKSVWTWNVLTILVLVAFNFHNLPLSHCRHYPGCCRVVLHQIYTLYAIRCAFVYFYLHIIITSIKSTLLFIAIKFTHAN